MINEVNTDAGHEAVLIPKNLNEVKNVLQSENIKQKITHDDFYNANLIAHELKDYIFEIKTYPELCMFMGHPDVPREFNKPLLLKTTEQVYCVYDTTFC